jgi:Spy/CpxP family protein refolding chaperone
VILQRHVRHLRFATLVCLLLGSVIAHAQGRGGGPGGPGGPGGMGGPMMGGNRGGDRGSMSTTTTPHIHTAPQLSLPGRWWDDKKTVKLLNLRTNQQSRMDDIFEANKGNLKSLYDNLKQEEQRFGSMSHEDLQDETKVFAEIDRVAQARADLEKANFHILLQIRKEMDPSQVATLDREIANAQ